ncbi:3',5'-nucleoside bisphosphate phosphatase [Nitrosomonas communis]|uniref:3',5'-nucleoside bisphosphate phosphatase n=1 Tax=Nitrosomonas communis TaxID=44574 RepID=UPI0026EC1ECB|nr:3',5'-nucleoside bisphosphate phosphatase [Nitrosomonas communis]MCO6427172.1 PHP domain-containing protein [Nitrosomonas communis]
MLNIDLHCHSSVSDGLLSPARLVEHAALRGVNVLALTDHDDVAGLAEARIAAREKNITLINGVEISVTWQGRTLHIIGLGINPEYPPLEGGLAWIRVGRMRRARNIAAELDRCGIHGSLEGAYAYAGDGRLIGRTHFARFLVEKGYAKDVRSVFKKYLVKGKPGYTPHQWATLNDAVSWIRESGGQAVIAHPARYQLGKNVLEALLHEFRELGGTGLEIISPTHTAEQVKLFATHAQRLNFLASCGSDYHGPGESYFDLGQLPPLPAGCKPIWHDWNIEKN